MPDIRVPVSLKFDQDSDLFNDLVVELRDNRDLSPFLVELLEMYYADTEVRDLINLKREQNNPFSAVREQLTKINLQHSKTVMATSMLQNQTQGIIDSVVHNGMAEGVEFEQVVSGESGYTMDFGMAQGGNAPQQQQAQLGLGQPAQLPPDVITSLLNRMGTLEKLVPDVLEKLNLLTSNQGVAPQQATAPQAVQPPTQQPVGQTQPQSAPQLQVEPPVASQPQFEQQAPTQGVTSPLTTFTLPPQKDIVEPSVTQATQEPIMMAAPQVVAVPEQSAPVIVIGGAQESQGGEPQMVAIPGGVAVAEEEQPKKPPSFAKAFGSIKKKS